MPTPSLSPAALAPRLAKIHEALLTVATYADKTSKTAGESDMGFMVRAIATDVDNLRAECQQQEVPHE